MLVQIWSLTPYKNSVASRDKVALKLETVNKPHTVLINNVKFVLFLFMFFVRVFCFDSLMTMTLFSPKAHNFTTYCQQSLMRCVNANIDHSELLGHVLTI